MGARPFEYRFRAGRDQGIRSRWFRALENHVSGGRYSLYPVVAGGNSRPVSTIDIGQALRGQNEQNVLVLGSGFSFHNLKVFFATDTAETRQLNDAFESWLRSVCDNDACSEKQRRERLVAWDKAPGAHFCHPREEFLLPLHVYCGASQSRCSKRFELSDMKRKSSLIFGDVNSNIHVGRNADVMGFLETNR